jgi:hypothetical protein
LGIESEKTISISFARKCLEPSYPKNVDAGRLKAKKEEISNRFPGIEELTRIAATLSQGRAINSSNAEILIKEAMELWKKSAEQRNRFIEREAYLEIGRENTERLDAEVPLPVKYPVDQEEFLRLLIGGKKSKREKIYRRYVTALIELGHIRDLIRPKGSQHEVMMVEMAFELAKPATEREIEAWMNADRFRAYITEERYLMDARSFLDWKKDQSGDRAKQAADKRWNKKTKKSEMGA